MKLPRERGCPIRELPEPTALGRSRCGASFATGGVAGADESNGGTTEWPLALPNASCYIPSRLLTVAASALRGEGTPLSDSFISRAGSRWWHNVRPRLGRPAAASTPTNADFSAKVLSLYGLVLLTCAAFKSAPPGSLRALTAASRTRPWFASGWGCRGRRLSRGRRSLGRRFGP